MREKEYYRRERPHNPGLRIFGSSERVFCHNSADLQDAYLNTISGCIYMAEHSFCGHDVMMLTGMHFENPEGGRAGHYPDDGRDIVIENHVWIASRAIILASNHGPRLIGHHSVIGAGAVVTKDVPPYAFVVGNPAVIKKYINKPNDSD